MWRSVFEYTNIYIAIAHAIVKMISFWVKRKETCYTLASWKSVCFRLFCTETFSSLFECSLRITQKIKTSRTVFSYSFFFSQIKHRIIHMYKMSYGLWLWNIFQLQNDGTDKIDEHIWIIFGLWSHNTMFISY